ncbi:MAG: alpha-ketoglutarate-dependent dioxygenase AlkB [Proteobacteria bacterium]|nr:alpha-ketoglutarate-dependent dioxygenase AlkB [Pseudomonadota bacterium]
MLQPDLFGASVRAAPAPPEGLSYRADALTVEQERNLAETIGALPFKPFEFQGHEAHRQVVAFGWRYDYGQRAVLEAEPIPDWLDPVRAIAADLSGEPPEAFVQVLINRYDPGAGIGWHRDRPQFAKVVGVSLLEPCAMRFRRQIGEKWERTSAPLAPRSAYLLTGPARREWQHSIAPMEALRYSVTLRTFAERRKSRSS